jgi:copper(I)-binding protein
MKRIFLLGTAFALAAPALAQVSVTDAWVRATVAGQKATGAFMQISDAGGGRLVEARSNVAGIVELHEMAMEGTTMRMRAVPGIELPAGKKVDLKPGGLHVMLMDLKQPLPAGESVTLTLVVEGKDKKRETVEVKAVARAPAGQAAKH